MKQLTKAEEEIMQVLWDLEEANVATVIEQLAEPKPAYNTVSTIIRILESKGFVDHRKAGKGYIYFPVVSRETYSNHSMTKLIDSYFNGSFKSMVSFFVKNNQMDVKELESILKEINKNQSK